MKKIFLVIGLVLGLLIGASYLGAFEFLASFNTVYTSGFTEEKFSKILPGMTQNQVKQVLGIPFNSEKYKGNWSNYCVVYSTTKPSSQTIPPFSGDLWWTAAQVCFDKNGKVIGSGYNDFFN